MKIDDGAAPGIEVTKQQIPSKKQRRHRARILSLVRVRPTLHLLEYTPEELQQTWYSRNEIREMKNEGKKIAGMDDSILNHHHRDRSDQLSRALTVARDRRDDSDSPYATKAASSACLRGLEGKTSLGLNRKRQVKFNARQAVLEEQQRQWERGICDAEAIAEAYIECTGVAQTSARILGLRDERDALSLDDLKSKCVGSNGNSLLQIAVQRWQSFEMHTQLL